MIRIVLTLSLAAALLLSCYEEKEGPSAEHVKVLTAKMNALEAAVLAKDPARIDSLLIPELVEQEGSAEAMIGFVYGADGSFALEDFGGLEIVYTEDKARADCFLMDSTAAKDRPVVFTFLLRNGRWLIKNWEVMTKPAIVEEDSTESVDS